MILFYRRFIHSPHLNVYRYVVESSVLIILLLFSPWWTVERTLPWQSIWGNNLSWASRYDIVPFIEKSEQTPIEIYIDENLVTSISPEDMGIYYDIEDLYRTLYAEQKLASVVKQSLSNMEEVPVLVYEELLDSVFEVVQSKAHIEAVNAKIELLESEYKIQESSTGKTISKDYFKSSIISAVSKSETKLYLRTETVYPDVSTTDIKSKINFIDDLKKRDNTTVSVGNKDFIITPQIYIDLLEDLNTESAASLSRDKVVNYVASNIAPLVAEYAIDDVQIISDGVLSETIDGSPGKILDEEKLVNDLINAFSKKLNIVEGYTLTASQSTVQQKRYSKSSVGLNLLLQDWDSTANGEWGVYIKDLSDNGVDASLNPDKKFVTASIYKLYVAAYTYNEIEKGTINEDSPTALGKSVGSCMSAMIVVSDNSCPSYFFDSFGYKNIQNFVVSNGYSNTDVDNSSGGDKTTTAKDTAKLLQDIKTASIIDGTSRDKLLQFMGSQIYRNGIPKGAQGINVDNKVGFLYDYNHDAGIVNTSSPYLLVILSKGASFKDISNLTAKINTVMMQ